MPAEPRAHTPSITAEMDWQMRNDMYRAMINDGVDRASPPARPSAAAQQQATRLKVFLSHSSADKALARRLAHDLQTANVDVWLDQWQIGVGEAFAQHIERGLERTDFVIVLLTCSSVASEWVSREWRDKVEHEATQRRVAVLPVRGEDCEMPDFLAQRSHANLAGGSYPLGFRHLLNMLRHHGDPAGIRQADEAIAAEAAQQLAHLLDVERRVLELPQAARALQLMLPVVTPIALEVSHDLVALVEPDADGASRALDQCAAALQAALQTRFGFPFPGIRMRGNRGDLPDSTALVLVDEIPELTLRLTPGSDDALGLLFDATRQVLCTMPAHFLDIDGARRLVDGLARTLPAGLSWVELTQVLQRLVDEDVCIGDLGTILDALAQPHAASLAIAERAEWARHALCAQITRQYLRDGQPLPVLRIGADSLALLRAALRRSPAEPHLDLPPERAQQLLQLVRAAVAQCAVDEPKPLLWVDDSPLRPFLRRLVKLEFPWLPVLAPHDLLPGIPLRVIAELRLDGAAEGQT